MPVPRDGDRISPSGYVVLRGRRGVISHRVPKGTCTWCGGKAEGRRRTWCGQWCVNAFLATTPERQRDLVRARDQGRCQSCGRDCARMLRLVRWLHTKVQASAKGQGWHAAAQRTADMLTCSGRTTSVKQIMHWWSRCEFWDVDHTVPISEGGHPYDLRNLRTLCPWCHARETAAGTERRAERRRGLVEPGPQISLFDSGAPGVQC